MRRPRNGLLEQIQKQIGRPLTAEEEYLLEMADDYFKDNPHPIEAEDNSGDTA